MKNNKIGFFSMIGILVIIGMFICMEHFIIIDPNLNLKRILNTSFDLIDNYIDINLSNDTKTIVRNGNISLNTNIEDYSSLDGYNFKYNLEYDKKNNTGYLGLNINDNIESSLYYLDDTLYIDFPYIISNMIKISTSENDIIDFSSFKDDIKININKDDLVYFNNIVKNSIINSINESNFTRNINGFRVNYQCTIKYSILFGNLIDDILNDKRAFSILNYSMEELNEFKSNLPNNDIIITFDSNLLGNNNSITILLDNKKLSITYDNENNVYNVTYEIDNEVNSINTEFVIEIFDDFFNIDGSVKFNMKEDKHVTLGISNVSTYNGDLTQIELKDSRTLSELSKNDINNINKIISNFK